MKPSVFLPVITALAGFGVGWLAKPTPPSPAPTTGTPTAPEAQKSTPTAISPESEPSRPEATPSPQPADQAIGRVSRHIPSLDNAKMARLVEALNLNKDQEAAVLKAVSAAQDTMQPEEPIDPAKLMEITVKAGVDLEKAMLSILTPEQAAAFAALRQRSQDNRIETNSQTQLSKYSKLIDLSPEQRELMLGRVRDEIRTEYDQRPKGLDLMLDISPLPTGSAYLADSAVASLPYLTGGENENQEALREAQRKNLDAEAAKYQDILTPAQLSRLQMDVEERKKILDRVEELINGSAQ